VLDKIAQLRQIDDALAEQGKNAIKQQGLGWPQPPDRISLIIRLLDTVLQEWQDAHAPATPAVPAPAGAVPVGTVVESDVLDNDPGYQGPPPVSAPPEDDHYEW